MTENPRTADIEPGTRDVSQISRFEDLEVWKESMRLAVDVVRELKDNREYGLRDQMVRSATSVPSNIAEGYERRSNREFIRYLRIASGSNAELRTQLYLALKLELIAEPTALAYIDRTQKITAQLINLIRYRRTLAK